MYALQHRLPAAKQTAINATTTNDPANPCRFTPVRWSVQRHGTQEAVYAYNTHTVEERKLVTVSSIQQN